ncbi:HNH endonuclease [Curtobacterium sp. MCLR17_039]|uniref:HNH endonuclease n=1 Tax=Curtobacterium sp. MCLR17_039 TaxID=2175624 RepID=UPI0011B475BD|nr:HNH endonuclease [Curtobacterium sp. MCLR17_039]
MRYLPPISYNVADVQFVAAFGRRASKGAEFWSEDASDGIKGRIKEHYIDKQQKRCCYCRNVFPSSNRRIWDAEHVVPRVLRPDFMFVPENLAVSCPSCNGAKSDDQTLVDPDVPAYPLDPAAFLIVHPHFDHYSRHIAQSGYVYAPVEGSQKGIFTIKRCDLQRFAGEVFAWPEPILDDRFEEDAIGLMEGASSSVRAVRNFLATVEVSEKSS